MPRVVLEEVKKVFEGPGGEPIPALSHVDLSVEAGECLVIVGPSGSGKTTLLRVVAGLEALTAGRISIGEKVVNAIPAHQRDVAMVFQSPALYPHMTAYENLGFGLRLRRFSRSSVDARVRHIAEMLGITSHLVAKPAELSGGQRQRVAIGRAIARGAGVVLLDEPLANVDPTLRFQLRNDIGKLRKEFGTTIIYVTHDHVEAMLMGDRIAVLRDGLVQQVAEPRVLYERPNNLFVASFVGWPPMNLFHGLLVQREDRIYFEGIKPGGPGIIEDERALSNPSPLTHERLGFELKPAARSTLVERYINQRIIFGLRPEHIFCVSVEYPARDLATVPAKVLRCETVGPDTFVHACCGEWPFVSRCPASFTIAPGQECVFAFNTQAGCFFDCSTGNAID